MKETTRTEQRKPRSLRQVAPLLLSGLALFAATTGIATALPGQNTVNSGDIKDAAVKSQDLAPNSVRSEELGDGIHAHSSTVSVPGGVNENGAYTVRSATASCGANEELISGSAHWSDEAANEELFVSEVDLNSGAESVTVKGGNDTGNARTLVAVAHCL